MIQEYTQKADTCGGHLQGRTKTQINRVSGHSACAEIGSRVVDEDSRTKNVKCMYQAAVRRTALSHIMPVPVSAFTAVTLTLQAIKPAPQGVVPTKREGETSQ